jgi:tRNA pseudouridine38-40 synthase
MSFKKIGDTMLTYKLIIEYDGTNYVGWQKQPNQNSIQSQLEDALFQISQEPTTTTASGRTDAGVHALAQVVSFRSNKLLSPREWTRALNGILPEDICVHQTEQVPDSFHARHNAKGKTYEYRILNHPIRPVLDRHRIWHIPQSLDLISIKKAADSLKGQHNFSSFEGSPTDNTNPICTIQNLEVLEELFVIRVIFTADRFLKQMVRAMMGTLVEVGLGKRSPFDIGNILEARDRSAAGKTAPPHGLYLMEVEYTKEEQI